MLSDRCKIIKREKKRRPKPEERRGQTEDFKAINAQEKKIELLHKVSIFKDNTEIISKLIKKETKAFIALNEKVQESELESPKMINLKQPSMQFLTITKLCREEVCKHTEASTLFS